MTAELTEQEIEHYREGHSGDVIAEAICDAALAHVQGREPVADMVEIRDGFDGEPNTVFVEFRKGMRPPAGAKLYTAPQPDVEEVIRKNAPEIAKANAYIAGLERQLAALKADCVMDTSCPNCGFLEGHAAYCQMYEAQSIAAPAPGPIGHPPAPVDVGAAPDAGDLVEKRARFVAHMLRAPCDIQGGTWPAYADRIDEAADTIASLRQQVAELKAERDDFHMQYRMKCDEQTKALVIRAEAAERERDALRKEIEGMKNGK